MGYHRVGRPKGPSEFATTNLSIRLTAAERKALEAHAAAQDKAMGVLIREILDAAGVFSLPKSRGSK